MKTRVEDIVRQRRNEFDDRHAPPQVWGRIEAAMGFGSHQWWNNLWLWRTAAAVFLGVSVYLYTQGGAGFAPDNMAVLNEFRDVEEYYVREISEKVELIDEFGRSERLNGFTQDFHQLEAMYQVLKEEMKARPSQQVKDALVLNLLVRIDLLNQQLHKLEQLEETEKQSEEEENSET